MAKKELTSESENNSKSSWFKPSLSWLLIFVPVAIALRFIPLEGWMGKATEHLAEHLGQGIGGLLNATSGNAVEPSSAVLMAMRDKMDLTLGIALGSSLQIALFVAPVLIFASYLFGKPVNLEFTIPEVVAVIASILIVQQICSDGESNWVEGVQLLSVYAILGILFYFLPDVHHAANEIINGATSAPAY